MGNNRQMPFGRPPNQMNPMSFDPNMMKMGQPQPMMNPLQFQQFHQMMMMQQFQRQQQMRMTPQQQAAMAAAAASAAQANVQQKQGGGGGGGSGNVLPSKDQKPPSSYTCFKCGQPGHWIYYCPNVPKGQFVQRAAVAGPSSQYQNMNANR